MTFTALQFFHVLMSLDIILAVVCAYLVIRLPSKYVLKFITIPILIFSTFFLVTFGDGVLGKPYHQYPKGEFEFLDYRVTINDGKKEIEIWVIQRKKSRLYAIPHKDTLEQQLAKAKSSRQKGNRQFGSFGLGQDENGRLFGRPHGYPKGIEGKNLTMREIPRANLIPPKQGDPNAQPQQQEIPDSDKEEDPETLQDRIKNFL